MAIPEELRETVFSYCKEEDTPDTLGPMTVAWDGAEGYLEGAGVTRPAPESKRHGLWLGVMLAETLDRYDNRGGQAAGQLRDNPAHRRALTQLRLRIFLLCIMSIKKPPPEGAAGQGRTEGWPFSHSSEPSRSMSSFQEIP